MSRRNILIETDELEAALGSPDLRIIDCDIELSVDEDGNYSLRSGVDNWRGAHIPGSVYIDIQNELSAEHPRLHCMLPPEHQFASVMSRHGIDNVHEVVVYSRGGNLWATRLYLMFREFGHDRVRVLNGAWDRWMAENRPVTAEAPDWPATCYEAPPPEGRFVDKKAVMTAVGSDDACVINALSPDLHSGAVFHPPYGRPGRIAGSVNLFYMDLIDPETNRFHDDAKLEEKFREVGALDAGRVITYCGGGIAATANAFALHLLGRDDVQVYDASLSEWGHDETLPMETG